MSQYDDRLGGATTTDPVAPDTAVPDDVTPGVPATTPGSPGTTAGTAGTTAGTTPGPTDTSGLVTTPPPTPEEFPGFVAAQASLDDLQMQDETVNQILAILDEAGQAVTEGQPRWVDPDVFGSSRKGERMARHTVSAQSRVMDTLDLVRESLAQHHGAMDTFRAEVRRAESETRDQLDSVLNRVDGVPS